MTTLHFLPRTLLQPSATNPRKHFDATRQAELRASIEQHGVLQPLIVRGIEGRDGSDGQPLYEIISGERRWRASEGTPAADNLPCNVGNYDDVQVLEIQLIENVQRQDLHPLEEAGGYGALLHAGRNVEEIAAAVGMSKPHVYARLRLLGLTTDARAAFFGSMFGINSALQIARLNTMHQAEICDAMQRDFLRGSQWTADTIAHHIRTRYTLRLAGAPFNLHDAQLLPAAGGCDACPKRSGANPELFDDITDADTCTDRKCFASKCAAHVAAAITAAEARGSKIIDGKEAERLLPTPDATVQGFLRLDRPSDFALSKKPLRELVDADDREATLIVRNMGDDVPYVLVEVMPTPYVRKLLADKGLLAPDAESAASETKPKKRETKVQPSAAKTAASETNSAAPETPPGDDNDAITPEIAAALDALTVFHGNASKLKPAQHGTYVEAATQRARQLLAADAIGRSMRNDGAEGFPTHGLSHLVARSVIDTCDIDAELLAAAAGIPADAVITNSVQRNGSHWLWALSEDEATRLAIIILATQDWSIAGKKEPDNIATVATVLGISPAPFAATAKALVKERAQAELLAAGAPKARPAAKKPPAAKYRDPATGATWSGKGVKPKWLKVALDKGRGLAEFDMAAQAHQAAPKPTLSPAAAWPFPGTRAGDITAAMAYIDDKRTVSPNTTVAINLADLVKVFDGDRSRAQKAIDQLVLDKVLAAADDDGLHTVLMASADVPY